MKDPNEDEHEYNLLVTRSNFHQRILRDKEKTQVQQRTNYLTKYISCGKHKNAGKSCDDYIVFPVRDKLPNERLPTGKQVLGYFFYTSTQNHGLQQAQNLHHVAVDIMNYWITCNIYTVTHKSVT